MALRRAPAYLGRTLITWGRDLASMWWVYVGLAAVITLMTQDVATKTLGQLGRAAILSLWISVAIGGSVTLLYAAVDAWPGRTRLGRFRSAAMHVVFIVVGVLAGTELAVRGGSWFLAGWDMDSARQNIRGVALVISTIVAAVAVGFERLRERADSQALLAEQARRRAVEAELAALQARTHPHFLFNALNTVASLAEEDASAAVAAIERLATLLRHSLEGGRQPRVSLARELATVEAYLDFERLRYGERLVVDMDVGADASRLAVLPGVVLPLVENAVNHGVAGQAGPTTVRVQVTADDEGVRVVVHDSGLGASDRHGTGTGQADARERVTLAYGSHGSLRAGPGPGGGYQVELRWPREFLERAEAPSKSTSTSASAGREELSA